MDRRSWWLLALGACLVFVVEADAQDISGRLVVYGRVQDLTTQAPLPTALVMAGDSSVSVLTDSLGHFAIPLDRAGPLAVYVEQFGYIIQRFELDAGAASRLNVLALEPAPFEIAAIDVQAEASLTRLFRNIRSRRNSAGVSARAFDRAWLDRFAFPGMSVLDLVIQRIPRMQECFDDPSELCGPGRGGSPIRLLVCIDEKQSIAPASELTSLWVDDLALLEVYRGQVRVYTARWMSSRARMGHTLVTSLYFGC